MLLPAASQALANLRTAQTLFSERLSGRLRVGVPDDYDDFALGRILAIFKTSHPGVQVSVLSGCTSGFQRMIEARSLDIAVCSSWSPNAGDHIATEDSVWAASRSFKVNTAEPLPIAVLTRQCWWRTLPTDALKTVDLSWRTVFESESFGSLKAAVRAGFAIAAVPRNSICNQMRILGAEEGLPPLPKAHRFFVTGAETPQPLADAMRDAVIRATA